MKMKRVLKKSSKAIQYKNDVRLKLLVSLAPFQEDVGKIRKDFDIPLNGFKTDEDCQDWGIELTKKERYAEYANRKKLLGQKYKLPANFYEDRWFGLHSYLVWNIVRAPLNNWIIESAPFEGTDTPEWLSIKTFGSMSKEDMMTAFKKLNYLQRQNFPKEITVVTNTKTRFERDLSLVKEMLARDGKPRQEIVYSDPEADSDYLSLLKRTGMKLGAEHRFVRSKEFGRPRKLKVKYTQPTSRMIGKKYDTTPEAVRAAKTRLNRLAKKLFGYGLWP